MGGQGRHDQAAVSLDRAQEERFFAAMAAVGFKYDEATRGFHRPGSKREIVGLWVTWDQALEAWLAADRGEQLEQVQPASETMARTIASPSNDT